MFESNMYALRCLYIHTGCTGHDGELAFEN